MKCRLDGTLGHTEELLRLGPRRTELFQATLSCPKAWGCQPLRFANKAVNSQVPWLIHTHTCTCVNADTLVRALTQIIIYVIRDLRLTWLSFVESGTVTLCPSLHGKQMIVQIPRHFTWKVRVLGYVVYICLYKVYEVSFNGIIPEMSGFQTSATSEWPHRNHWGKACIIGAKMAGSVSLR